MDFRSFYLTEGTTPPGFNDENLFPKESLDQFIEDEDILSDTNVDDDEDLKEAEDAQTSDYDINKGLEQAKASRESMVKWEAWKKLPIDIRKNTPEPKIIGIPEFPLDTKEKESASTIASKKKLLHRGVFMGFKDDSNRIITAAELRALITERPKKLIGINSKLKKSGKMQRFYDLTMPAYKGLYVNEKAAPGSPDEFKIIRTCPMASACKRWCYALRGGYIQYKGSSLASARVVNFLMNDYEGFKAQLINELENRVRIDSKAGMQTILRWHDSGDFMSESYLQMAFDVANESRLKFGKLPDGKPMVLHYAYTKMIPMIRRYESEGKVPPNFVFNFSFGGMIDDGGETGTFTQPIDVTKEKHSRVVPLEVFKDIPHSYIKAPPTKKDIAKAKEKGIEPIGKNIAIIFAPDELEKLRTSVANYYGLDPKTVVSYDELMNIPYDPNRKDKLNAMIMKGSGDDAATRKDVLGTLLFIH